MSSKNWDEAIREDWKTYVMLTPLKEVMFCSTQVSAACGLLARVASRSFGAATMTSISVPASDLTTS